MADLTTSYLGLPLKNPLVVAPNPLCEFVGNLQRMEAVGVGAVVLHSLFEEQISLDNLEPKALQIAELPHNLRHVPQADLFTHDAGSYLAHIVQAKQAVDIPVFASLNGYYAGGWVEYAQLIEESGADGLELNVYYLETKGTVSSIELEQMYLDLVARVKASIAIPVAIKLSPYFTGMAHFLSQLDETAVNGIVLFNRFYQPDIDLESQTFVPSLSLSSQDELRLRLRWTALLADRLQADIGITGGVHTAEDVVKCLLAGGKVAMMATAVLTHGIDYLAEVLAGLDTWLDDHGYESVAALNGRLSQKNLADASALERANYMRVLKSYARQ